MNNYTYIKQLFDTSVSSSKGFMFIVEGADAVGKTTLINELSGRTGFKVVKGSDFSIAEKGVTHMFLYMLEQLLSEEVLIVDRSFISNLVYAPLYDKNMLNKEQVDALIRVINDRSLTVYLKGDLEICTNRIMTRGDDYVKASELEGILSAYDKVISDVRVKLPLIEYSIKEYDSYQIVNELMTNVIESHKN